MKKITLHLILVALTFIKFNIYSQITNEVTWAELTNSLNEPISNDDIIVVGPNDRLVLNHTCNTNLDLTAKGILVYGEFVIKNSATGTNCSTLNLTTDWVLVVQNGLFQAGTESEPYSSKFTLTLSGGERDEFSLDAVIDETENYISTNIVNNAGLGTYMPSPAGLQDTVGDSNYSFLMAMGTNARIEVHTADATTKKSWVQLEGTVSEGSNQLTFAESTGWEMGDRIAIASTDYDLNQAEDFTITGVSNNGKTVTIDASTAFMHYGEIDTYDNGTRTWDLDMRAEVGLLNRNFKIKGDVDYDADLILNRQEDQFGGHVMIMMDAEMHISGAEFEYMGQAGELGRYPAHWHMLSDSEGQYVKNSAFHHTFNKGITIHGTHNSLVENNLVYESIGHSYFFEDGSEVNNTLINNLAINARKPRRERLETPGSSDFDNPSNYWIENANNVFINNHAAGSEEHGFWFELRGINGLSSSGQYRDLYSMHENRGGPTAFTGNHSHSANDKSFGLNHAGYIRDENYLGTDENPQQVNEFWNVNDFTSYKSNVAIYVRGIGGDFNEVKTGENNAATRFRLNQSLNNSLVVGRTLNVGNPTSQDEISAGRSLPTENDFTGQQLYDGPGGLENVHFSGFTEQNDFAITESNAIHKSVLHYAKNITFNGDIPASNYIDLNGAVIEAFGLVDIDGSITGTAGATIVNKLNGNVHGYLESENSTLRDDWTAVIHPPEIVLGSLKFRNGPFFDEFETRDGPIVNGVLTVNATSGSRHAITTYATFTRSDGVEVADLPLSRMVRDQSLFIANNLYAYKVKLTNAPENFEIYMNDLPMDDSVIYEVEGLNINYTTFTLADVDESPLNEVSSMDDLESVTTTSFFKDFTNGTIFIKMVAQMRHGFNFPQPKITYLNREVGGVKINVIYNTTLSNKDNPIEANNIVIYPNPIVNSFKVNQVDDTVINKVQIISVLGKVVKEFEYQKNTEYDISNLNLGLYIIVLKNNNEKLIYRQKIIKNK